MADRITANPNILGGKPIIKGTRLSVEFILELLSASVSVDEIIREYPHITKDDVNVCLKYAASALKNDIIISMEEIAA